MKTYLRRALNTIMSHILSVLIAFVWAKRALMFCITGKAPMSFLEIPIAERVADWLVKHLGYE